MTLAYWPSLLRPETVMFKIRPMNISGPASFSGKSQNVGSDAGYWVAKLTDFPIRTPDQIREFRATIADLEGSLGDLIIGPFDCRNGPRLPGLPLTIRNIPHSDGALFSDTSGYSQSAVVVVAADNVALRSTTMRLVVSQAGPIERGMYFSVQNGVRPSLHIITKPPEFVDDLTTVEFRPPLRFPVSSGDDVNFSDPKATMSLVGDAGELAVRMRRWASPSIDLEESWNGL